MRAHRGEINAIALCGDAPTFANTVAALDRAGRTVVPQPLRVRNVARVASGGAPNGAAARSASQRNSVGCEAVRADRSPARGPCEPVATRGRASAARARPSGFHARRRAAIVTCEKTSRGNRRAPCDLDNTVQPERPRRCEVLDADGFSAFVEAGNAFDTTLAERLWHNVYAAGGTVDPAVAYRAFRGREASVEPMLAQRGLIEEPPLRGIRSAANSVEL